MITIKATDANIVLPKYSSLQNCKEKLLNILQEQFEAEVDTYLRITNSYYKQMPY